jgi:hypothetical protein
MTNFIRICFEVANTDKAVVGWHHGFVATIDTVHANVYRLFGALKIEQVLTMRAAVNG